MGESNFYEMFLYEHIKFLNDRGIKAEIIHNVFVDDVFYTEYIFTPKKPVKFITMTFDIEGKQ